MLDITKQADNIRIDIWFYYTRIAKTRSLCTKFIKTTPISLNNRHITKPHTLLRIGDILTFPSPHKNGEIAVWKIRALGIRRGTAIEASLLYEEIPE